MDNINFLINEYVSPEKELVSNLANISAILYNQLEELNWLGFYIANYESNELYLGPFQGLQATTNIKFENGVCGYCATTKETVIVPDVHCFEGHIACDIRSKSEIVVPVFNPDGSLYAIIDVDSPVKDRFSNTEKELFEEVSKLITTLI